MNDEATKEELACSVCEHEWTPRVTDPAKCPSCQSKYWEDGLPDKYLSPEEKGSRSGRCKNCGNWWTPIVREPSRCPECKSTEITIFVEEG